MIKSYFDSLRKDPILKQWDDGYDKSTEIQHKLLDTKPMAELTKITGIKKKYITQAFNELGTLIVVRNNFV